MNMKLVGEKLRSMNPRQHRTTKHTELENTKRQAKGIWPGWLLPSLLAFVLTLAGCKGFIVNPTLTSITATPTTPSITAGNTQQMVATGTYNDSSTKTVTSSVTWASSDTSVARINSIGLVTGISAGTASITATLGTISGATTATVTIANLQSITVSPTTASITSGETQAFAATGTLEDGSTVVITDSVTWTSSNTSAATIAATGTATAQSLTSSQSTYITASSGSVSSNAVLLTVNP
jgi:uncharacterized protein YjdB